MAKAETPEVAATEPEPEIEVIAEAGQSIQAAINSQVPENDPFAAAIGGGVADDTTTVPAMPDEEFSGTAVMSSTPDLEDTEMQLPRLRLAQGQTQEVTEGIAKPGQWVLLGEEPMQQVTVIPLMMGRQRKRMDPNDRDNRQPLCTSADARRGVGDNPAGGDCSRCPLKEFQPDPKTGRNARPQCSLIYRYLVWVIDAGSLAELQFSGTATNAAKYINTFVATKRMGNFAVQLGSKTQTSGNRTFYSPTTKLVPVDVAELEVAKSAVLI